MPERRYGNWVRLTVSLPDSGGEEAPIDRLLRTADETHARMVREDSSCHSIRPILGLSLAGCGLIVALVRLLAKHLLA